MDNGAVLVKTPKGVEEFERRTCGLPPRTRQILILADGKRDRATLASMLNTQDLDVMLDQLVNDGFLAIVAPQAETGKEAGAPRFEVPTDPQERHRMARTFVINTTEAFVGVFGTGLIEQAKKAQTSDDLRRLVDDWHDAIVAGAGKKRAAEMNSHLMALL